MAGQEGRLAMKEMDDEFFVRGIESKARRELRISHIIVIPHKQRLIDFYINLNDDQIYAKRNRMEVKTVVYIKVFVQIGRSTQLLFIGIKTEERKERERERGDGWIMGSWG